MYSAVAAAGQRLAETHDLASIFGIAVESVTNGIRLERGVVLMSVPDCPELVEVAASEGYDDPPRFRIPRSHPALAALPRRKDLGSDDGALAALGKELLIDEYAIFPLSRPSAGNDFVALVAGNHKSRASLYARVTPETMVVLELFAGQVTTHIENARRYRELRMRNAEVERANQTKTAFLATMSHELRTPLNAIIGFTRLVIRKSATLLPDRQIDNLRKVEVSAVALLAIINDLLDLSKVEAGRMTTSMRDVDLNAVVEQVIAELGGLAAARSLGLVADLDRELPKVSTDEQRVRQILINLTSNAIKFTRRGTVRVRSIRHSPEAVLLRVEDTGIGIPAEEMARIFEPSASGRLEVITREVGGTGLGLSIVRQMAALLGGTVRVESEVGVGSSFTVELPVTALPESARNDASVEGQPMNRPSRAPPTLETGVLILVVDDDQPSRELVMEILSDAGYSVRGVDGAEAARAAMKELPPRAIVLDLYIAPLRRDLFLRCGGSARAR